MDPSMLILDTTSTSEAPDVKRFKLSDDQVEVCSDIEYNEEDGVGEIIFEEVISQEEDGQQTTEINIKLEPHTVEINPPLIEKADIKGYLEESKVIRNIPPASHMEEMFICDICGNTYDKKSKLSSHLKNHSDFKPHQCE